METLLVTTINENATRARKKTEKYMKSKHCW